MTACWLQQNGRGSALSFRVFFRGFPLLATTITPASFHRVVLYTNELIDSPKSLYFPSNDRLVTKTVQKEEIRGSRICHFLASESCFACEPRSLIKTRAPLMMNTVVGETGALITTEQRGRNNSVTLSWLGRKSIGQTGSLKG